MNVLSLFEHTVLKNENKIAVIDPNSHMTYGELRDQARAVGTVIADKCNAEVEGFPVAILANKSCQLLTTMLGTVYAGGFYVSINPEQPADRIQKILDVLEPELIIVEDDLKGTLDTLNFQAPSLAFSELDSLANADPINPLIYASMLTENHRENPLYGIFTSGSTGTPKCVLVSQGAVIDFIGHFIETFQFTEDDIIGNQAPFDFDVSVKDIYTALFTGASLVLIPREYFSTPAILLDYLVDHHVTNLTWAVSALCIISGMKGFDYKVPSEIKRVLFSGEVMPSRQLRIWQDNLPECLFVNLYGPSEITCNCTYYVIDHKVEKTEKLPLGKVFAGREVMLCDEEGHEITELNQPGEICCSGESLAICYYHNEEETASHFVERPNRAGHTVRTYRTGDLAYLAEDGQMYFAGRSDFQIKHMGHRIELEEIERNIMSREGVERCVCAYDEKRSRISLYYTGAAEKTALHLQVKEGLPLYMVPNKFIHVKEFILNKNGKIDRKLLENLEVIG